MSRHRVALMIATALLVVLAGCGGSSGSMSTPNSPTNETPAQSVDTTATPSNRLPGVVSSEFSFPPGVSAEAANIDADRLERRHFGHLQDADSYVVRMEIRVDRGRNTDVQVAVRRQEDGVGTLTEIKTERFVSEIWRPASSEAVFLKQGDSVTYVGPGVEAQIRQAAIHNQSVALFVDQLGRRDMRSVRGTNVRGDDAVVVAGNASVVPGDELHEPASVRNVQVNGTITANSMIKSAQVQYVRTRGAGDPTVTRTYEVVSLNQGTREPEWVHDAPRISADMVNERIIRVQNTGARPIPVGSRVFVQLDNTVLSVHTPEPIAPGETVRLYRPAKESGIGQDSTDSQSLRVSIDPVEFDEVTPFGNEVTVVVRVGDDAARVAAS